MAPLEKRSQDVWDDILAVNARGVWRRGRIETPARLAPGGGAIVNTSSIFGLAGRAEYHAYVASKHAVVGMTRSVALEYEGQQEASRASTTGDVRVVLDSWLAGGAERFHANCPRGAHGASRRAVPFLQACNDSRTLAIVQGLERALPDLRMEWEVSEDGRLIALPQRDTWLIEGTKDGEFPLVCNGDESFPVTVHGLQTSARHAPGGQPLLDVHAKLPLDAAVIAAAAEMLEGIAEGACAF